MSTAVAVPIILGVLGATIATTPFIHTDPAPTDVPYLSAAIGSYDVLKNHPRNVATDFRAEFDPNAVFYKHGILTIRPTLGAEVTSDWGQFYYAGVKFDAQYHNVYFSPTFAPGAYFRGDGKALGSILEFRSGAELGYEFDNKMRLGVNFSHTSNAGISGTNPGVEVLSLYYHYPLGK